MRIARRITAAMLATLALGMMAPAALANDRHLATAIASPLRSATNSVRDRYRHPAETLRFFGLERTQTVLEVLPSGGYWTEILAPYLGPKGHYIAAIPQTGTLPEQVHERSSFQQLQARDPKRYGKIKVVGFDPPYALVPAGSVDLILTFRNLHNWMKRGTADQIFAAFYRALKPGGVLGIEDHRGRADKPQDPQATDGYVREDYAVTLIEKAGFKLVATSEIGANPKDIKNYPAGVWTLPPSLKLGAQDRAKYLAIGESDRFTLKFIKPAP